MPNPICFGYSMDNFLSERGNQSIAHVQCMSVCIYIQYTVIAFNSNKLSDPQKVLAQTHELSNQNKQTHSAATVSDKGSQ